MTEECERSSGSSISILLLFLPLILVLANHHDSTTSTNAQPASPPVDYMTPINNGLNYYKSYGMIGLGFTLLIMFTIGYKLYTLRKYSFIIFLTLSAIGIILWFTNGFSHLSMVIPSLHMGNMTR